MLERRAGGRLWLRVQTAMVLMLSFAVGAIGGHMLLKLGLGDMRLRFPITVLASYAAFLLLVRLWLEMTGIAAVPARLDPEHEEAERQKKSSAGEFVEKAADVADGIGSLGDCASLIDAEGCLPAIGFVLFLAVLGFVLTALWWFFGGFFGAASAALVEAGVEALLAVGMARAVGGGAGSWIEGAVRASWKYWLALAGFSIVAAFAVHAWVPEAHTILQAITLGMG